MIRAVTIDFDVNIETKEVTNVKVQVEGQVKRATTTRKKKEVARELEDFAIITREENRIVFNNKAFDDMGLEAGQRVVIKYKEENKKMIPIIGTDESFDEEGTGNKLTKSQTISFKGNQNTVLAEFGTEFTIKEDGDGIWKLISNTEKSGEASAESLEAVEEIVEQLDADLLTEDDEDEYEINELTFNL